MGKYFLQERIYSIHNMLGRKDNELVTLKDVPANDFIAAYADFLKRTNKIELPKWVDLVKTGHYHELAPYDEDWFYTRAAAIMRKIYVKPCVGVGRLANKFGAKERNGSARKHHAKDSKGVIRACMKSLEKARILMKRPTGDQKYFCRVVTPEGQKAINHIAGEVYKTIVALELLSTQMQINTHGL